MNICGVLPHTEGHARYQIASCRSCAMIACVFNCVTITWTGSTGSSFFSPQSARPARPPRMSANTAMTTYFMDSKIPEFLLQQTQSAHSRRFRSQHPGAHPDRRKPRSQRRVVLNLCQSAFRPDQDRRPFRAAGDIHYALLSRRRQKQGNPTTGRAFQQPVKRHGRSNLRYNITPALLARRDRDTTPMLNFLRRLAFVQPHHSTFSEHRHNPCDSELGSLLHTQIHSLTARYPLRQSQPKRRLPLGGTMLAHTDLHRIAAYLIDQSAVFTAAPVEKRQLISNTRPQYPDNVIAGTPLDRQPLADRQLLINIHPRQSHVAISIPSRATVTINSISSGVITYGGMKYITLPIGRNNNPRAGAW